MAQDCEQCSQQHALNIEPVCSYADIFVHIIFFLTVWCWRKNLTSLRSPEAFHGCRPKWPLNWVLLIAKLLHTTSTKGDWTSVSVLFITVHGKSYCTHGWYSPFGVIKNLFGRGLPYNTSKMKVCTLMTETLYLQTSMCCIASAQK